MAAGAGCKRPLDTQYGRVSGWGGSSVNGTRVLADMFADRGHKVDTYEHLSPSLQRADVIVWFPDDFRVPSSEVRDWLDGWLLGRQAGR